MSTQFTIEFVPSGRGKARCPADPLYPNGKALDITRPGQTSCTTKLPYPAPECGYFQVRCLVCELSILVTAAGRPDDATSLKMPCRARN